MSWSSDVRCLYCDGRLPLYRKITNGQFCSAPHRKLYWQEQERLGVERLHQTHDSLRAFRPAGGVEAILGQQIPASDELAPPPRGILLPPVAPKSGEWPSFVAADPHSFESEIQPRTPLWAPQIAAINEIEAPAPLAGLIQSSSTSLYGLPQAQWPADRLEAAEPNPLPPDLATRLPLRAHSSISKEVLAAGVAKIPIEPRRHKPVSHAQPLSSGMLPCRDVSLSASPQGGVLADQDNIPRAEKLALTTFAPRDFSQESRRNPWPPAPFAILQKAHLPLGTMECGVRLARATPMLAGLRKLSVEQVPLVHGTWIDSLRALGTDASHEVPRYELSTPALRPRLRLAAGSRYAVATRDPGFAVATIEPENLQPSGKAVAIPERKAMAAAASAGQSAREIPAPGAAGLIPLAGAKPNEPTSPQTAQTFNPPQPLCTEPRRPASQLEPIDAKPIMDFMMPAPEENRQNARSGIEDLMPPPGKGANAAAAWSHVSGFWQHAPRDLKLLMIGIPILLALALHPSLKKIPYTAPAQAVGIQRGIERNFQSKLSERWQNVRQTLVDRAAVALDEDFRAGLDDWTSRGGTTDWAFDATGFVRPGPLALYRPTIDLTDYQLQFLGLIDKKALSWVVRAADFDDYYVVKLVVLKPGPVPTIGVTRYAVIQGVAQNRVDTTAFINAREDMLYRVQMDIHGDGFALTVQGQLVDSWSEPRLRKGGVGFFTARGEASRLRWVQVTHQYDMLGRLCAYLAPYNIPSTNGGWQP